MTSKQGSEASTINQSTSRIGDPNGEATSRISSSALDGSWCQRISERD